MTYRKKTIDGVIEYARSKGFGQDSKILNITHADLDGLISTVNIAKYLKLGGYRLNSKLFYAQKTYDNINSFFTNSFFKGNCRMKNPDFVLVTDISVDKEIVEMFEESETTLIVLDHHQTAYSLNNYDNCFVDDTETKCGAEVTYDFLRAFNPESMKGMKKINRIATEFDLFKFKNERCRKFTICGKKRSLAEMFNIVYFNCRDKDQFINRWYNGWGDGFTKKEAKMIKDEYQQAVKFIKQIDESKLKIDLDENKVLILTNNMMGHVGEYYLDVMGKDIVMTIEPERCKASVRASDNAKINVGKILDVMKNKLDYVTNGGGHEKAGGCGIRSVKDIDDFVESFMKLCAYYDKKE